MYKFRGFTAIEMLVTVAVAGVLLALAVPGFNSFILDSKRSEVVNELVSSFQLARSEAVRRGQEIGVCASSNGTACTSNTNWSQGWIVFVNSSGDAAPDRALTEELLRVYSQPSSQIVLTASSFGGTSGRFKSRTFGQTSFNGSVKICDPRGSAGARRIVVSPSATVRVENTSVACP